MFHCVVVFILFYVVRCGVWCGGGRGGAGGVGVYFTKVKTKEGGSLRS